MPTWGWFLTAVVGALIVWGVPKLAAFFAHALADELVEKIGDRLEPRWSMDFDDALAPIASQVAQIKAEVTLNGGGSMKDMVLETQRQVEYLITSGGHR